jgi:type IV secretory pathway TraG/TraD family ATPase VirD4
MTHDPRRGLGPVGVLFVLLLVLGVAIALLEQASQALLAKQGAGALPSAYRPVVPVLNAYLATSGYVLGHWFASIVVALISLLAIALLFLGLKKLSAAMNRWRDRMAGLAFKKETYDLPPRAYSLGALVHANPAPAEQVVLGLSDQGEPVYLTDRARSMHVHVLGQTGSGKTRSVIEPLVLQDLWRGRGVLVIDGKGAQENEERLASMAAAAGRLDAVKIFTLSPFRPSHTYNPLHLVANADPQAVAERVFSTFAPDMDVPYYRDQSSRFFVALVCVLAATGKRFTMLDVAAAISSRDVLAFALAQTSDRKARRSIEAQLQQLGRKVGETFTGLLAAVSRYDIPSVNAYDPDIVLEDEIERAGVVGFFLPANYYKQLARYIGLCVLQHVQQVGALRQLDRSRSQQPLYVYSDEFYTFAYEGFTDAVNKLRDANISLLLSHQTFSDLEKVSKEFARGIWDNTRNKIVLYQNDPEVCDRIAKALGTKKDVELTVRRSVDVWMNSVSTHEASSKEVDAYRCHPNRIKSLKCGQAYLAQDADFTAVHLQQLPSLPAAVPPPPKKPAVEGIGLHEMFLRAGRGGTGSGALGS